MPRDLLYPPSVKPGIPKLGEKPKNWDKVKFGDILQIVGRPAKMGDDTSYQLVTAKRGRGGIVPREILQGKKIKTKTQFHVKEGDFLISKRQIVHGACGLVPKELDNALVSNEYSTLLAKDDLSLAFFNYYTHSIHFQKTCFHSSVGVAIEKMIFRINDWMKHELYLPPYAEQKKIAEILGYWDLGIEQLVKLIATKQKIKKYLMQQLLTGHKRFDGFNGQEWKTVKLSDLGETYSGLSGKTKEDFGSGSPYIPYLNIFNNSKIDIKQFDYVSVGEDERQNEVLFGDIFFTTSSETPNEVGMAAVLMDKVERLYLNSFCFGFRLYDFEKLLPEYARYCLRGEQVRKEIFKLAQGATRFNLSKKQLLKLPVTLPPIKEQEKIASVLDTVDSEIKLLCDKLEALKNQKNGLMQKLLTGRIRVKV